MNLQNGITASQIRVKMEAFAIIPQLGTHVAARMITLGTTAIVSIITTMYILKIRFNNIPRMANSYVIKVS